MTNNILTAFKTHKARRPANEDACLVLTADDLGGTAENVLIVADGMGGRASGQVASAIAVDTVRRVFESSSGREPVNLEQILLKSLREANSAVYLEAGSKPELNGMGTTCVAAAVRDGRAYLAHMGDSRAYLLREGGIRRLTEDHSFVAEKIRSGELTEEQARTSRFRNVITRAIGLEADARPEVAEVDLQPGDVLLLCTDGLTGPVTDDRIADILCTSSDVSEACERLVDEALRNGGSDNITVAIAAYGTPQRAAGVSHEPRRKSKASWVLPALIGLLLGIGIGLFSGQMLLQDYLPEIRRAPVEETLPLQPELAGIEYEDPLPLLYVPIQGGLLTLDSRGYLHVLDNQGRLLRLDRAGQVVYTFPARESFLPSSGNLHPAAVTDREGNLYITDTVGKRILKFGHDGLFLESIGEEKLTSPESLAVDDDGSLYVIDLGRLKVIRPRTQPVDLRDENTP